MRKRWFIRKDVDIKEFAKAAKACKEFSPDKQKSLLKLIKVCKLEKFIAPGIKKRRIRKKHIKRIVQDHKEELTFRMLDMMEERWADVPEGITRQDGIDAFEAIMKLAEEN